MKKYIQKIPGRFLFSLLFGALFALIFHFSQNSDFLNYFYMGTILSFLIFTFFVHYKDFKPFFFGPEEWKDKDKPK